MADHKISTIDILLEQAPKYWEDGVANTGIHGNIKTPEGSISQPSPRAF